MMFGDFGFVKDRGQEALYKAWLQAVDDEDDLSDADEGEGQARDVPLQVCVLEIGCGKNVPSVRMNSEALARKLSESGARTTLIRINPDHPDVDGAGNKGPGEAAVVSLR